MKTRSAFNVYTCFFNLAEMDERKQHMNIFWTSICKASCAWQKSHLVWPGRFRGPKIRGHQSEPTRDCAQRPCRDGWFKLVPWTPNALQFHRDILTGDDIVPISQKICYTVGQDLPTVGKTKGINLNIVISSRFARRYHCQQDGNSLTNFWETKSSFFFL